jgi:hypothetical protein
LPHATAAGFDLRAKRSTCVIRHHRGRTADDAFPPSRVEGPPKRGRLNGDPTALGIAASDPLFQAQGLSASTSIADALRFLELTITQAHAFSCDCGGTISDDQQADQEGAALEWQPHPDTAACAGSTITSVKVQSPF